MKKAKSTSDDLRPEYYREDFGEMVRGKYASRAQKDSNIVVLAPDVAEVFPNADAVNQALRQLIEVAKKSVQRQNVSLDSRN